MVDRRDTGYTSIHYKNGDYTSLSFDAYDKVKEAWMKGSAFYEWYSLHGSRFTVKLGDVSSLIVYTPEQIKSNNEEAIAHKNSDSLTGLD